MNLASIAEPHDADAVALVSRGESITYGTLRERVARLRAGLVSLGLEPGDRVGIVCANTPRFVESWLAVLGAGLVAVPLNPQSPGPELTDELAVVGARAVLVGELGAACARDIDRAAVPALEHVLVFRAGDVDGALTVDDLPAEPAVAIVDRAPDDLATLMFTSGTAGSPRAAMLTHGNLLINLEQMQSLDAIARRADDIGFGLLPLFHIFGLNVVLNGSLLVGSPLILVERFDPMATLELIRSAGITLVTGPPTMWGAWAALPDAPTDAFASVRLAASGAARLPVEIAERIEERFGVRISEGYGLTETSPVVTTSAGTDSPFGSIGRPLPGVEVRLIDDDGHDVLVGDDGEIWVRGPHVFTGYWDDPVATDLALTPDGWLRTGDMAVIDDVGHLFIVDRAKDLIIVSGFNVYPAEVEAALSTHPAVAEAAVVGVPHPHTGEAIRAYVVIEPGAQIDEEELIAHVATRLARYKCPNSVEVVPEIPRGLGGKLLRREFRAAG
ncbi:MAG TPA: AMP-binding protein [Acidimicrobiales bacterium]|nr:AMP-binding protein [Acidimicrobiales bacterium]